ncbi:helix-turn-helix domain-containing protein [Paracoccus sp. (in: a-proteobacteria)]|uniref:helix-turn-helix domain-containing protein n=1 Tax=Paracoccus sp. TaxID=267 RepID=UPI0034CEE541
MGAPLPIFIRPFQVQQVFGIHRSTLYRWANQGLLVIHKRGNMAFVRAVDVEKVIVSLGDQMGD